jgi:acyl-CoA synthetase (AMP-forming)/AMP-acid ligase II
MDMRSLFLRAVETWPDREAIAAGDVHLTFSQAWERGLRLADVLREHGVRAGDRVAVLEDNTLEAADVYVGCTAANFVRVPLYARNSSESHRHMIRNTGCTAVVVSANHAGELDGIEADCPDLRYVLVRDASYEGLLAAAKATDLGTRPSPDEPYVIRHTAGTTGRSKGVAYTHWKWLAYCRDWFYPFPGLEVGDANLCASPISHGSGYFFTPVWIGGGRNVLLEKVDPKACLDLMERERVAYMWCVPTLLGALARHESAPGRDWSALKAMLVAGAPITETTARAGHAIFGDTLYSGYGQTECFPITQISPREWFSEVPGSNPLRSAGRAYGYALVKIVDPETRQEVAPGAEGEIVARADGQMIEYWNDPEATAAKIQDGWIMTGDVGRIDRNGYVYLLDRASDLIISGGFNIYPAELENVIAAHPAVAEVAVFAVPDERWGESPAAVVVVEDPAAVSQEEIVTLCAERLGSYKKPKTVVITTEPLPKSAVGKILRRVLREPYWADRETRVAGS